MGTIQWSVKKFSGLGVELLHDILRLRVDVFVVEQNCAYPELDGLDAASLHVIGQLRDGTVAAYARILPPKADGLPHIGRVVVAQGQRGQGIGKCLMEEVLRAIKARHGSTRSALAAQAHLQNFYANLGFGAIGTEYLLDGIPHVDMARKMD